MFFCHIILPSITITATNGNNINNVGPLLGETVMAWGTGMWDSLTPQRFHLWREGLDLLLLQPSSAGWYDPQGQRTNYWEASVDDSTTLGSSLEFPGPVSFMWNCAWRPLWVLIFWVNWTQVQMPKCAESGLFCLTKMVISCGFT